MNTKNIILVGVGVIILGLVVFFSIRQKTETPTVPSASGGSVINISGYKFDPNALTVKKGTTVTWTNNDGTTHTVTADVKGDAPASGAINKGQSFTYTFGTAGTYGYHCSIHPSMTGSIIVTE